MLRWIHAPDALKLHCRATAMAVNLDHRDGVESLDDGRRCDGAVHNQIAAVRQTPRLGVPMHVRHPSDARLFCRVDDSRCNHQTCDGVAAAMIKGLQGQDIALCR